jgi:hypothetical protein
MKALSQQNDLEMGKAVETTTENVHKEPASKPRVDLTYGVPRLSIEADPEALRRRLLWVLLLTPDPTRGRFLCSKENMERREPYLQYIEKRIHKKDLITEKPRIELPQDEETCLKIFIEMIEYFDKNPDGELGSFRSAYIEQPDMESDEGADLSAENAATLERARQRSRDICLHFISL